MPRFGVDPPMIFYSILESATIAKKYCNAGQRIRRLLASFLVKSTYFGEY
jgi:hypothetical protein